MVSWYDMLRPVWVVFRLLSNLKRWFVYCTCKVAPVGSDRCHVSIKNNQKLIFTAPAVLLTAMFVVWVCIMSKLFRYPH